MEAGKLTERITIQRPDVQRDVYGSTQTVWTANADGPAEVPNPTTWKGWSARVVFESPADEAFYGLNEEMRILWDNLKYRILSIDRRTHRREYLIRTELINE